MNADVFARVAGSSRSLVVPNVTGHAARSNVAYVAQGTVGSSEAESADSTDSSVGALMAESADV